MYPYQSPSRLGDQSARCISKLKMRTFLFTVGVLALLALACTPLQILIDVTQPRFEPPPTPRINSQARAVTPTRTAPQTIINGSPLALNATAHENIYNAQGVPGSFQQMIAADAELASRHLISDLGWSGSPRVNLYVFPSRGVWLQGIGQIGGLPQSDVSFQASLQGDAWITIGGTVRAGIYLYPIQQSPDETLHMLAHEYTHVVQQQTLNGLVQAPDWFLEGMAEAEGWRVASAQYPKEYARNQAEMQRLVKGAAKEKGLFPLTGLSAQQSWQMQLERPWTATLEYAESQMAIEYMQKIKGTNAPMNILIMTANDGDFAAAFQQTIGLSIDAFETKFFASLK